MELRINNPGDINNPRLNSVTFESQSTYLACCTSSTSPSSAKFNCLYHLSPFGSKHIFTTGTLENLQTFHLILTQQNFQENASKQFKQTMTFSSGTTSSSRLKIPSFIYVYFNPSKWENTQK
uniref:Uncharacterized protein n=1 Tax=Ascaris lumbricoides TaxID=6252 RepID=A0A0M3I5W3_ASCLU